MTATAVDDGAAAAPSEQESSSSHDEGRAERRRVLLRTFWLPFVVIALLGLGIRLAVIQAAPTCADDQAVEDGCFPVDTDTTEYIVVAQLLADGEGYTFITDESLTLADTAHHPPAFSTYLAAWSLAGVDGFTGFRRAGALLGLVTMVLVADIGRRLGGRAVGLVAGLLVAVHPALWLNDVTLLSESIYQPLAAFVVWSGYRLWCRRTLGSAALLGAACGLAALSRTEGALLGAMVAVPLAIGMVELRRRDRLGLVLATGATSLLVVAPWIHLNSVRFDKPVLMTSTAGQSLFLTNQPETYYGHLLGSKSGYAHLIVVDARAEALGLDESQIDRRLSSDAAQYTSGNEGRLPTVVLTRVARMWGLYKPAQMAQADYASEGRLLWPSRASWWVHGAVLPLAVAGLVLLWRRGLPVSPLAALLFASSATSAINFGLTRYRAGADVALCVLAAVALVALARWLGRLRERSGHPPGPDPERPLAEARV
ncbi:MAG: ArnT family glycosyltransferase [Iamia sp.]